MTDTQPTDPVKTQALSNLLGLAQITGKTSEPPAEKKEAAPPAPEKKETVEKKEAPAASTPPAEKKEEPKAAPEAAATPAAEKKEPAEPAKPKVSVAKRAPVKIPTAAEIADELEKRKPAPKEEKPQPVADDLSGLSDAEKADIEAARFLEKKDPTRKGSADGLRDFFKKQREFVSKRSAEEGDDYDPKSDPKFAKFLQENRPNFRPEDRVRARELQIAEQAKEEAVKETRPHVEKLERRLREIEERPKIAQRVSAFVGDMGATVPEDIAEHFKASGNDWAKVQEAFPEESEIVSTSLTRARDLTHAALEVFRGVVDADPKNPTHQALDQLLVTEGERFAAEGGDYRIDKQGRTFVPIHKFDPSMSDKHWTMDEEMILATIKAHSSRSMANSIKSFRDRFARQKAAEAKIAAQKNAAPKSEPVASPQSAPQAPIDAKGEPAKPARPKLSAFLGYDALP